MEKKRQYYYFVKPGEEIHIKVTPVGVGPQVKCFDGPRKVNGKIVGGDCLFIFPAGNDDQIHQVTIRCDFPDGTQDDAHYKIKTGLDPNGEWFPITWVRKDDRDWTKDIRYEVVT